MARLPKHPIATIASSYVCGAVKSVRRSVSVIYCRAAQTSQRAVPTSLPEGCVESASESVCGKILSVPLARREGVIGDNADEPMGSDAIVQTQSELGGSIVRRGKIVIVIMAE